MDSDRYLTREEAAKISQRTLRTIDYHVKKGGLKVMRVRGRTFITKKSFEQLFTDTDLQIDERTEAGDKLFLMQKRIEEDFLDHYDEIDKRLGFLEKIIVTTGRPRGLNTIALLHLANSVLRFWKNVQQMTPEEISQWRLAVEEIDIKTIRYCFSRADLRSLPLWLLKLGNRMAQFATPEERERILIACRNLRYILQTMCPPAPVVRMAFPIPNSVSPVDALILASYKA